MPLVTSKLNKIARCICFPLGMGHLKQGCGWFTLQPVHHWIQQSLFLKSWYWWEYCKYINIIFISMVFMVVFMGLFNSASEKQTVLLADSVALYGLQKMTARQLSVTKSASQRSQFVLSTPEMWKKPEGSGPPRITNVHHQRYIFIMTLRDRTATENSMKVQMRAVSNVNLCD